MDEPVVAGGAGTLSPIPQNFPKTDGNPIWGLRCAVILHSWPSRMSSPLCRVRRAARTITRGGASSRCGVISADNTGHIGAAAPSVLAVLEHIGFVCSV